MTARNTFSVFSAKVIATGEKTSTCAISDLMCVKFTVAVTVTPVLFPDQYGCSWLEALTGYQSPGLRG